MRGCLGTGMCRTRRLGTPAAGADRTRPAVPPARRPGPRRSSRRTRGQRRMGLAYLRDRTSGGRTAAEALTCTSIARRRVRHPNQTCRRHEGDINPAALALLRSKAASAVASSVVSERRAQRPPASGPSTDDHGRCVERRLAVGGATSHHVVHWRDQMSADARNSSRLTSARCPQPITRWPARRSSSHASST
jgi:hypothetical protein